jgi:5'-3' exonuclease
VAKPQLLVSVFDTPQAARQQQQQQRQQLAPEYLARRKRRRSASARTASTAGSSSAPRAAAGDPLRPFKQQVMQQGGVCLEAAGGWEADDGMAAACRVVAQRHPTASILLASGDADMQQLLTAQVGANEALSARCRAERVTSPRSPHTMLPAAFAAAA